MKKITYKQNGMDKEVYFMKAKTKLLICKTCYGMYAIYFEDTLLKEVAYLQDAKDIVESLIELGIGRDYANERW